LSNIGEKEHSLSPYLLPLHPNGDSIRNREEFVGINIRGELPVSLLLASVFGKITSWSVKMEDPKLDRKFIGLATNRCVKIKGEYMAAFMKL